MTQCRMVEKDSYPKEIGDMWFDPDYNPEELSDQYRFSWEGKRPPIVVMLPDKTRFCIDARNTSAKASGTGTGWEVHGEPPNLTCAPSIHVIIGPFPDGHEETSWHGYLTNGELK